MYDSFSMLFPVHQACRCAYLEYRLYDYQIVLTCVLFSIPCALPNLSW